MPRYQVAYLAGTSAVIGFALCYLLSDFGGWPLLMYEPYAGQWLIADAPPSASAMVYPGMLLWGMAGALVLASLSIVIAPRLSGPLRASSLQLMGAWAISSVVFAALYFLWGLWPF